MDLWLLLLLLAIGLGAFAIGIIIGVLWYHRGIKQKQ